MKHLIALLIIIFISIMQHGCLRTYYPAEYYSSAPVMVSETNNNLDISSNYLGADYTIGKGSYENETVQLMRVNYLIANTQDHTNFNLEGFGYTGNYKVSGLDVNYDGDKTVIGLGTDFKFNVNFKFDKFKPGAGMNFGLGVEFGEYYEFRKNAADAGLISEENNLVFLILSFTPTLSYEFSESTVLSAQFNVGLPGGVSPSIVLNHNRFVYWITWLPDDNISTNNYGQRITFGIMVGLNNINL